MLHLPTDEKEVDSLYDSCFAQKRIILLIENVGFAKQIQDLTPSSSKSCLVLVTSRKDLAMDSLDDVTLDSTLSVLPPLFLCYLSSPVVDSTVCP